jgi:geranylgeranyl diphosphate synthase type I
MDKDERRRGAPTIYHQYELWAREAGLADPLHFGRSMAICFSDIALFYAYDLLGQMDVPAMLYRQLSGLLNREFTQVALAQMQDMHYACTDRQLTTEQVSRLYLYKTARYTFSVPLMSGALLAGQPAAVIGRYAALGEKLGLIFQIKDDELGLFGTEAETGKPVGSDISEGKKTLYYLALHERATPAEKERLAALWGRAELPPQELDYVRELFAAHDVQRLIAGQLDLLAREAEEMIEGLQDINSHYKPYLRELLAYNLTRKK